ncbi:hypothetical protein EJ08DRAFT_663928 [Tothia fuscella]|uniref:Uncharacterized protein n=1 Tax=Tothia fuscella TaxID=1048955 RepID=A0A9P4TUB2_9PEZI|nr:hypothetical protein EJ08DRAFT_663928 [Tothia fuscella]
MPKAEEEYCWERDSFTFAVPLEMSVACGSNTYILSRSKAWHETVLAPKVAGPSPVCPCLLAGELLDSYDRIQCEIYANSVKLLYAPPKSLPSMDMCATTPHLTLSNIEKADYIPLSVHQGVTMFNDKAYLSVEDIYAWTTMWTSSLSGNKTAWNCERLPLGKTIKSTLIEIQSEDLSSIRIPHINTSYPFNYADLIEPVPRSAWLGVDMYARVSPYYFGKGSAYEPQLAKDKTTRHFI